LSSAGHHILITGASSGIGAALARHYAAPGARLALGGRDATRLAEVARACRDRGAAVAEETIDVTDRQATRRWVEDADDRAALDLVIANAGIGESGREREDAARRVFAVNLDGVLNTCWPAIDRMSARGAGQLAIMSSLAGYRGIADAPSYSASKAAVKVLGEAWRGALAPLGIRVSVICPGFVSTPMTAGNDFHMPFLMAPERAAGIVARGLKADRPRISFPLPMTLAVWFVAALPQRIGDRLLTPRSRRSAVQTAR